MKIPKYIVSRDGLQKGKTTGGQRPCKMEGCTGVHVPVRWPNGKLTMPCSKGMEQMDENTWKIV